ncbi:MAG: mRNA surveillance protein pelota [Candidatus Marsarchaeota archaeon]|jgi:protein pelota|nr:mRNA surveillance protein pelota [Candidatus Marsarchaeota archaeon]
MRIIRFYESSNLLKLVPESFEDLYLLARILSEGDRVGSKSFRRFKSSESDVGEQKEVFIKIILEKAEIDRSASRLRLTGRILEAKPEEFVRLNTYHTLNIAPSDPIDIEKNEWRSYILKRLRQAVLESKRPRLGVIALDEEKATTAYVMGYGIEIASEIYSRLSKKMKEKEFELQRLKYFDEIIAYASRMNVDTVIFAGPGFTKDNLKQYIESKGIKSGKKFFYAVASDAERSGIREVMQSSEVSRILENEHVRHEFEYLNIFFGSLRAGKSIYGVERLRDALQKYSIGVVLVNDSVINRDDIRMLLESADQSGVHIEIFNSEDEAGQQLSGFGDIAGIEKTLLK